MLISQKYISILLLGWFLQGVPCTKLHAQEVRPSLYFISDSQQPLPLERIILKAYNNTEGRDSLFRDIEKNNKGYVFMLGDLVGEGSKSSQWTGIDAFLKNLHISGTKVYAIPGNHEYLYFASRGIAQYRERFPDLPVTGYCIRTDSIALVMLNSNFGKLPAADKKRQQQWYLTVMDSLDADSSVKVVVVCTHHSPYSNSKVVGSSAKVQEAFVPRFEASSKAKLFVTGHSHNLEYFAGKNGKRYLVIGGGGGLEQPVYSGSKEKHPDLIPQGDKPRFFYLVVQRRGNMLDLFIRGYSRELLRSAEIRLSL